MIRFIKTLPIAVATMLAAQGAFADTIRLAVDTKMAQGKVYAGLFSSAASFEANEAMTGAMAQAVAGGTVLEFKGLVPGTYGFAIYHDVNGNQTLDTTEMGRPTEPYGFSNNPEIKRSAPSFESFQVVYDGTPLTVDVILKANDG